MSFDSVLHRVCGECGGLNLRVWAPRGDGTRLITCNRCGGYWVELPGPDVIGAEGVVDYDVPEDIPIREKDTGNIFHVRVEDGQLRLYDVEGNAAKRWWEVWK